MVSACVPTYLERENTSGSLPVGNQASDQPWVGWRGCDDSCSS